MANDLGRSALWGDYAPPAYAKPDTLALLYPRFTEKIDEFRALGKTDEEIGGRLLEWERGLHGRHSPDAIAGYLGRTPENVEKVFDFAKRARIDAYLTAFEGELSRSEIAERVEAAELLGVPESLLLTDDAQYQKFSEEIERRRGYRDGSIGQILADGLKNPLGDKISAGFTSSLGSMIGDGLGWAWYEYADLVNGSVNWMAGYELVPRGIDPVTAGLYRAGDYLKERGQRYWREALDGREETLGDRVLYGLGSTAAFMIPGSVAAKAASGTGRVMSALAYAASKGGLEALTEGGGVFRAQLEQGAGLQEASSAARIDALAQFPINFASDALGSLFGDAGFFRRALGRGFAEMTQETIQGVFSGLLSRRKADGTPYTWGDLVASFPEMAERVPEALWNEGIPAFISAFLIGAGEGLRARAERVPGMVESLDALMEPGAYQFPKETSDTLSAIDDGISFDANTNQESSATVVEKGRYADLDMFLRAVVTPEGKSIGASMWFDVGNVSDALAQQIQEVTGIDVSGYIHTLEGNAVNHALKDHGIEKAIQEEKRGQVPITLEDFKMLPDIVMNPDEVLPARSAGSGNNRFILKKRVNGYYVLVEEVKKRWGKVMPVTMWKVKAKASPRTSETSPTTRGPVSATPLSGENISPQMERVNAANRRNGADLHRAVKGRAAQALQKEIYQAARKAGVADQEARDGAALWTGHALIVAREMGVSVEEASNLVIQRASREMEDAAVKGNFGEGALYQTMDRDVDLTTRVPITDISREASLTITNEDRKAMSKQFDNGIVNNDSGIVFTLSSGKHGAAHIRFTAVNKTGAERDVLLAAFYKLPEIVAIAKRVKTTRGRKQSDIDAVSRGGSIKTIRRFLTPVKYDGKIYILKLTAKEYEGVQRKAEIDLSDPNTLTVSLYDQNTAKIISETPQQAEGKPQAGRQLEISDISEITIGEMAVNVKDTLDEKLGLGPYLTEQEYEAQTGKKYPFLTQLIGGNLRGMYHVDEESGRRVISLFKARNKSTFVHEIGHILLDDLQMMAEREGASEAVRRDWETAMAWLGWEDGQRTPTREQHERFADGFLNYLETGKAPSASLRRVFARFRAWLRDLFATGQIARVEMSDAVREVYDRLIAPAEELADGRIVEQKGATDENITLPQMERVNAANRRNGADLHRAVKGRAAQALQKEIYQAARKAGVADQEARDGAALWTGHALIVAREMGVSVEEASNLVIQRASREMEDAAARGDLNSPSKSAFLQTMDKNVDLNAMAQVVALGNETRATITDQDRKDITAQFGKGIVNEDTGMVFTLSTGKRGAAHIRHSAVVQEGSEKQVLMLAFFRLPELAQKALKARTTQDRKAVFSREENRPSDIQKIHRFLIPVRYGEGENASLYVLKLTAKEYKAGVAEIDLDNPDSIQVKLYDQSVAKKISGDSSASEKLKVPDRPTLRLPDIYELSLGEMAVNVKDTLDEKLGLGPYLTEQEYEAQTGKKYPFFTQLIGGNLRGMYHVDEESGRRVISLFKARNKSTFVHEIGHILLDDLQMMAEREGASEAVRRDWETARAWLGWEGGQRTPTREQHERFADGFLNYLETGKAPSASLRRVFARFRAWLRDLFATGQIARVEMSHAVREVYDRLIAPAEEVTDGRIVEQKGATDENISPQMERVNAANRRTGADLHRAVKGRAAQALQKEIYQAARKAGVADQEARDGAALWTGHALIVAREMGVSVEEASNLVIQRATEEMRGAAARGEFGELAFFQTMDRDVDLTRRVPIIDILDEPPMTITNDDRKNMSAQFGDGIVNVDTGIALSLSSGRRGAGHVRNSAVNEHGDKKQVLMAAFFNLPRLARDAVRVKTSEDRKVKDANNIENQGSIKAIYRFLAPIRFKDKLYILKLTAKEYVSGRTEIEFDENTDTIKLYDVTVAKTISGASSNGKAESSPRSTVKLPDIDEISIGEMAVHVKDTLDDLLNIGPYLTEQEYEAQTGKKYSFFQLGNKGIRGMYHVDEESGRRVISLFKARNKSTFVHEIGHILLDDLQMMAEREGASEAVRRDWETARAWLGWEDGQRTPTREQHERFADGFLNYLETGKAPSASLRRVFARFRAWLRDLFATGQIARVEMSDAVREVYDRLIAPAEELADEQERTGNRSSNGGESERRGRADL